MILYHGTYLTVEHPDLKQSREDIDFGVGFYTTLDKNLASKWACNKKPSILNWYEFNEENYKIKELKADREWLDFVSANRNQAFSKLPFHKNDFDIIKGPIADDKMFEILDLYYDGIINADKTIEMINCLKYSDQIVFVKQKFIDEKIIFKGSKELYGFEKQRILDQIKEDRLLADALIRKMRNQ